MASIFIFVIFLLPLFVAIAIYTSRRLRIINKDGHAGNAGCFVGLLYGGFITWLCIYGAQSIGDTGGESGLAAKVLLIMLALASVVVFPIIGEITGYMMTDKSGTAVDVAGMSPYALYTFIYHIIDALKAQGLNAEPLQVVQATQHNSSSTWLEAIGKAIREIQKQEIKDLSMQSHLNAIMQIVNKDWPEI